MASRLICTMLIAAGGVAIAAAALSLRGCDEAASETTTAKIGGQWFTLEAAVTLDVQKKGLGGRTEIASDGGMIFVYGDDEERTFWMKDCLIDMDILFIDRVGTVVSLSTMKAVPLRGSNETEAQYEERLRRTGSYVSHGRCRHVIEIQAGKAAALGVKRGDKVELDLRALKELAAGSDGR